MSRETENDTTPYPWLPPLVATIKAEPEDFRVEEVPATTPEGQGEHVWLEIEKRLLNSEDVAVWLGRESGAGRGRVSYAGRKDRQAVTRQWFSVQCPPESEPDWAGRAEAWNSPQEAEATGSRMRVLRVMRHARKLRTGHLAGNRFEIRLGAVQGDRAAAESILAAVRDGGIPNYFGAQRFGRDNLERARAWLGGGRAPRSRNQRSLLLSAARSAIFNAVLAARVRRGDWDRLLPGDVANLEGSGSVFAVPEVDAELEARAARLDIHPTGPLWGRGAMLTAGEVAALEAAIAAEEPVLAEGLEQEGVRAARRSLRMVPRAVAWRWEGDDLWLSLELGAGEYATGVLDAIGNARDADRSG
ncbi:MULTISPECIES: tRNA pseudouridine(13) synthase TruD [unclassified Thioalkalivibrio]|uniref:tRNA pseudouridine(13) synthase TruD n=1 Tax=unclassified Thioalkalivibrio TaxID=2621013 RepID=UPI00036FE5C5|nr:MULTISPECIES: tRNA pseudouridine(13) synthase TruD [unclassified Thioalkalivibrio]